MNKNDIILKQILLNAVRYKDDNIFEGLEYIQSDKKECFHEIETIEVYQNTNTKDFIKFTSSLIDKETQEIDFSNKLVDYNSNFYVLFYEEFESGGSHDYALDICSYDHGSIVQIYYDTALNEFVLGTEDNLQFTFGSKYTVKNIHKLMTEILPIIHQYLDTCNKLLKEYTINNTNKNHIKEC